jgi:DNA-binding transcriptional LysR family regulator
VTTIDLNRVASFVRVVEAGSFTAAARQQRVPVSSVSRALANLESELGVRLLHRTTRKLSLTDAGEHFFRRMQAVVAETEDATRAVLGFATDPRGSVRITAPVNLGEHQLPRIIANIVRRHPAISIDLRLTNSMVDLVAEGVDLALRFGMLADSSLVTRKVAQSDLGIFAAPAYLERCPRLRSPADLSQHACLSYAARDGRLPWRLTGPQGETTVSVSGPIVCNDMVFLREAAQAGLGLALIPVEITSAALKARRLVRVLPRYSVAGGGIFVVWPSQQLVPARVVAVREMLVAELAELYR